MTSESKGDAKTGGIREAKYPAESKTGAPPRAGTGIGLEHDQKQVSVPSRHAHPLLDCLGAKLWIRSPDASRFSTAFWLLPLVVAEPAREGEESLPAATQVQPSRLVPVERRGAGAGQGAKEASFPERWLQHLPLVSRSIALLRTKRLACRCHVMEHESFENEQIAELMNG
jgi:hypothetical protein